MSAMPALRVNSGTENKKTAPKAVCSSDLIDKGGTVDGFKHQRPLPHNDRQPIRGRSAIVRDDR
jgi:hypothetical protein